MDASPRKRAGRQQLKTTLKEKQQLSPKEDNSIQSMILTKQSDDSSDQFAEIEGSVLAISPTEDVVLESSVSSPVTTATGLNVNTGNECRRSSRKKIVKFDVRDLLNKNRKSHKIQIEARIDSNAPGPTSATKSCSTNDFNVATTTGDLTSKQKTFIEKAAIFRRFSISDQQNKVITPIRPPPLLSSSKSLLVMTTNSDAESESDPTKIDQQRRLSRTQEIFNASMLKSKQNSSLIIAQMESGCSSNISNITANKTQLPAVNTKIIAVRGKTAATKELKNTALPDITTVSPVVEQTVQKRGRGRPPKVPKALNDIQPEQSEQIFKVETKSSKDENTKYTATNWQEYKNHMKRVESKEDLSLTKETLPPTADVRILEQEDIILEISSSSSSSRLHTNNVVDPDQTQEVPESQSFNFAYVQLVQVSPNPYDDQVPDVVVTAVEAVEQSFEDSCLSKLISENDITILDDDKSEIVEQELIQQNVSSAQRLSSSSESDSSSERKRYKNGDKLRVSIKRVAMPDSRKTSISSTTSSSSCNSSRSTPSKSKKSETCDIKVKAIKTSPEKFADDKELETEIPYLIEKVQENENRNKQNITLPLKKQINKFKEFALTANLDSNVSENSIDCTDNDKNTTSNKKTTETPKGDLKQIRENSDSPSSISLCSVFVGSEESTSIIVAEKLHDDSEKLYQDSVSEKADITETVENLVTSVPNVVTAESTMDSDSLSHSSPATVENSEIAVTPGKIDISAPDAISIATVPKQLTKNKIQKPKQVSESVRRFERRGRRIESNGHKTLEETFAEIAAQSSKAILDLAAKKLEKERALTLMPVELATETVTSNNIDISENSTSDETINKNELESKTVNKKTKEIKTLEADLNKIHENNDQIIMETEVKQKLLSETESIEHQLDALQQSDDNNLTNEDKIVEESREVIDDSVSTNIFEKININAVQEPNIEKFETGINLSSTLNSEVSESINIEIQDDEKLEALSPDNLLDVNSMCSDVGSPQNIDDSENNSSIDAIVSSVTDDTQEQNSSSTVSESVHKRRGSGNVVKILENILISGPIPDFARIIKPSELDSENETSADSHIELNKNEIVNHSSETAMEFSANFQNETESDELVKSTEIIQQKSKGKRGRKPKNQSLERKSSNVENLKKNLSELKKNEKPENLQKEKNHLEKINNKMSKSLKNKNNQSYTKNMSDTKSLEKSIQEISTIISTEEYEKSKDYSDQTTAKKSLTNISEIVSSELDMNNSCEKLIKNNSTKSQINTEQCFSNATSSGEASTLSSEIETNISSEGYPREDRVEQQVNKSAPKKRLLKKAADLSLYEANIIAIPAQSTTNEIAEPKRDQSEQTHNKECILNKSLENLVRSDSQIEPPRQEISSISEDEKVKSGPNIKKHLQQKDLELQDQNQSQNESTRDESTSKSDVTISSEKSNTKKKINKHKVDQTHKKITTKKERDDSENKQSQSKVPHEREEKPPFKEKAEKRKKDQQNIKKRGPKKEHNPLKQNEPSGDETTNKSEINITKQKVKRDKKDQPLKKRGSKKSRDLPENSQSLNHSSRDEILNKVEVRKIDEKISTNEKFEKEKDDQLKKSAPKKRIKDNKSDHQDFVQSKSDGAVTKSKLKVSRLKITSTDKGRKDQLQQSTSKKRLPKKEQEIRECETLSAELILKTESILSNSKDFNLQKVKKSIKTTEEKFLNKDNRKLAKKLQKRSKLFDEAIAGGAGSAGGIKKKSKIEDSTKGLTNNNINNKKIKILEKEKLWHNHNKKLTVDTEESSIKNTEEKTNKKKQNLKDEALKNRISEEKEKLMDKDIRDDVSSPISILHSIRSNNAATKQKEIVSVVTEMPVVLTTEEIDVDPLKDIEKFIEDGVNLLKCGYKNNNEEESVGAVLNTNTCKTAPINLDVASDIMTEEDTIKSISELKDVTDNSTELTPKMELGFSNFDTPDNTPIGTPRDTPIGILGDTSIEIPQDTPIDTSRDTPIGTPRHTSIDTPRDTPIDTPRDTPIGALQDESSDNTRVEIPEKIFGKSPQITPVETPTVTPPSKSPVQEEFSNGVRRSHRIKQITKTPKVLVGRGLVEGKPKYSINEHLIELAEAEQKNAKFLKEMQERLNNFHRIRESIYKCERVITKEARTMLCDCFVTEEEMLRGEMACGDDCLNRLLMIECGPGCNVKSCCTNQRFQKFLYAPCRVFRTEKKGFGIMAETIIYPNEFIMEYVGEVIDIESFQRRRNRYARENNPHFYFMALRSNTIIDATLKGNISRFINHSCEPNAMTQKWTINGELRIGFFSLRTIMPGEEITFDYRLQRYGRTAQRCYCEAPNCRGWIGKAPTSDEENQMDEEEDEDDIIDDDSDESPVEGDDKKSETKVTLSSEVSKHKPQEKLDDMSKDRKKKTVSTELPKLHKFKKIFSKVANEAIKEKKDKRRNKKWEQKPKHSLSKSASSSRYSEDPDVQDEIRSLSRSGLKNQPETLRFSRLMLRAKLTETRLDLLKILRKGDFACRRLFLDYHGLRLLHGWMSETENDLKMRKSLLLALEKLPVPNRTVLIETKVYQAVKNWGETESGVSIPLSDDSSKESANSNSQQGPPQPELLSEIKKIAASLIEAWDKLPNIFKIPKRERFEQMKEHEREADEQYADAQKETIQRTSFVERFQRDRFGRGGATSNRYSKPNFNRDTRYHPYAPPMDPRRQATLNEASKYLSKQVRRQMFADSVKNTLAEAEKRLIEKRNIFETKCRFFGLDPANTRLGDLPFFVNPLTGQWYSVEKVEIPTPPSHKHVIPAEKTTNPAHFKLPATAENLPKNWKFAITPEGKIYFFHKKNRIPQWLPPTKEQISKMRKERKALENGEDKTCTDFNKIGDDTNILNKILNPQIKAFVDKKIKRRRAMRYSRLVEVRAISPRREEDRIYNQMEVRKYKENKEKIRKRKEEIRRRRSFDSLKNPLNNLSTEKLRAVPIQDYLLSSDEDESFKTDVNNTPLLDKIVQGDKIVDELEALDIKRPIKRSSSYHELSFEPSTSKEGENKRRKLEAKRDRNQPTKSTHSSKDEVAFHRIRERFRYIIGAVVVQRLKSYRSRACTQARIENDDDFNHLVRKLTHFVLLKEMKYCESFGYELEANDSVKGKAKEFIRKYMSKYGEVYEKPDSDPEFKEIPLFLV